jgi:hypothetical protein
LQPCVSKLLMREIHQSGGVLRGSGVRSRSHRWALCVIRMLRISLGHGPTKTVARWRWKGWCRRDGVVGCPPVITDHRIGVLASQVPAARCRPDRRRQFQWRIQRCNSSISPGGCVPSSATSNNPATTGLLAGRLTRGQLVRCWCFAAPIRGMAVVLERLPAAGVAGSSPPAETKQHRRRRRVRWNC